MFPIAGLRSDLHLGQIDTGFALVAGVVADIERIVMPNQSGVARVTAAWKLRKFGHCAFGDINISQRRKRTTLVHSACSNPVSTGYADKVWSAEPIEISAEVFELPVLVIRLAYA